MSSDTKLYRVKPAKKGRRRFLDGHIVRLVSQMTIPSNGGRLSMSYVVSVFPGTNDGSTVYQVYTRSLEPLEQEVTNGTASN